jgi:hypothetical protein
MLRRHVLMLGPGRRSRNSSGLLWSSENAGRLTRGCSGRACARR